MPKPQVYNMPSGAAFLPSLAMGLQQIYQTRLQDALILLPTRRAVRALGNAFVDGSDFAGAALLPRMRPLADINPEEPPFEPGELAGLVRPAIDPVQRRFEMAKLVYHAHTKTSELPLDAAGALALADPLIAILDDADMEKADLSRISELDEIQKFAAQHFQNAITLYKIVQEFWPKRLAEIGLMQPFERRVALLEALTEIWTRTPPDYPVIIAGSTGTLKASAQLMRCVAHMADGMIVLPGLNTSVPDEAWGDVGAQHPQNSLKNLIDIIGIDRGDVPDWTYISGEMPPNLNARRRVISEALVPMEATGDWPSRIETLRKGAAKDALDPFKQALQGLSLIEADNDEEEALSIALIMRESLSTPSQTAALVTPDPSLARRVKARLRRWGVEVDYSQGEPLEETALGAFLASILARRDEPDSEVNLAVLCKHPLTGLATVKSDWLSFELQLRGGREKPALSDFTAAGELDTFFAPLLALSEAGADEWARALAQTAEALAAAQDETGAVQSGAIRLWVGDAGEKAAQLLESLISHGHYLPKMDGQGFTRLFGGLMRGKVVRPRYGTHPRLSILGPLEARMLTADRIILGGLNEGVWPAAPPIEPFLSRGMRETLRLSLPERRFGLSAHDFAELAANPDVILTRAKRSDDGPKVASRWLWRLKTLIRGALPETADQVLSASQQYLSWARALDFVAPDKVVQITRPCPKPDPAERWPKARQLSITQIKTWIRDPYSIYARHILALYPLDDLDRVLDVRDYGNALHKGLEDFTKAYPKSLPQTAQAILIAHFKTAMRGLNYPDYDIAKETARLENIAAKIIPWMAERRAQGWAMRGAEVKGKLYIEDHDFTLNGTADLIEKGPLGYAVTDYKTGAPPGAAEVNVGFDPQLPLSALMLREGAFDKQGAGETHELNYIRLKGAGSADLVEPRAGKAGKDQTPKSAPEYADFAQEILSNLIISYGDKETGYSSQPRAQFTHDYGDYDHLARREEWMRLGAEAPPTGES